MADFRFNGVDGLIADFDKLAKIDDETKYSILEAGAEVVKLAQQAVIRRLGLMDPVAPQLINSLKIERKKGRGGVYVQLLPKGKRKKKNGESAKTTNSQVGYYLEHGTPRIKAKHWMEAANEESAAACTEAEQEAWNKHLDDLNL